MELRLDIGFNEIISLIKQLPMNTKVMLRNELEKEISTPGLVDVDLTNILINGPVMSIKEYEKYQVVHKYIGEWTWKLRKQVKS